MRKGIGLQFLFWVFVLTICVPSTYGQARVPGLNVGEDYTQGVQRMHMESTQFDIASPSVGEVVNYTYNATKLHDFDVIQHTLIITIDLTATFEPDSTGVWNLSWEQDDSPVGTCQTDITIIDPGVLGGSPAVTMSATIHCARLGSVALNDLAHNHTLTADLAVESGSPADIQHLDISVNIEREDVYMIPQSLTLEPLDTWIPLLFWLGAVIFALRIDSPWIAGFSIPGFFEILFPDILPFEIEVWFLFLLIGAVMEYFAYRKRMRGPGDLTA